MRVLIVGAGAVGSLFGALLSGAGHSVLLIGRSDHVARIRTAGLRIEGTTEGTFWPEAEERIPVGHRPGATLLTTKTFDVVGAAREIGSRLPRPAPLLLSQNGLGVEELALAGLREGGWKEPARWVVRAVNKMPATLMGPGVIRHAGRGEVLLDRAAGRVRGAPATVLYDLLASADIPVRWADPFARELWRKALVNAAINPVTAEFGVPNGRLAEEPYRSAAVALLREAQAVARSAGETFDDAEADADLFRVVQETAANRSSMLQDLDRGRPTEIDAISGSLLERGRAAGLALPATEAAIRKIRERVRSQQV